METERCHINPNATALTNPKVVFPRLGDLKLNPRNARVHPEAQIGQIARSIERFGFNNPVLVDGQNNVLAGEGRVKAATTTRTSTDPRAQNRASERSRKTRIRSC